MSSSEAILCLLCLLAVNFRAQIVLASVTAKLEGKSWNGGGQYVPNFKNNDGSKIACSVKFSLTPKKGTTIGSVWGANAVSGASNQYTLAPPADIAPGATHTNAGVNINGNGAPTLKLIEAKYFIDDVCGGAPAGSCMGCLSNTKMDGPINKNLNKPFKNSVFTFYGAGGRGACGLDAGVPKMSAAGSGNLFKPDGQWVDACRKDKRTLLDDPICKNICVKIDYNGKTECTPSHVDLSIDAFNYLEPRGGLVGKATGLRSPI
uniref:EXP1 protein n=1 Tax=Globodera rostochiensis TaxID=31243 RepID=Q564J0_GLORO|nr:EXP1 protein [Globodera rostochiensis]